MFLGMSREMLAIFVFGYVLFLGFYIKDKKKPKKINNLDKVINSAKYDEVYKNGNQNNRKLSMRYMQETLSEERRKKLIPILGLNPEQLEIDLELTDMKEKTSVLQIIFTSVVGLLSLIFIGGAGVVLEFSSV